MNFPPPHAIVRTNFVYENGQVALERNSSGQVQHVYLNGPLADQAIADETLLAGGTVGMAWSLADNLGTPRRLVRADGSTVLAADGKTKAEFRYDSFGNPAKNALTSILGDVNADGVLSW